MPSKSKLDKLSCCIVITRAQSAQILATELSTFCRNVYVAVCSCSATVQRIDTGAYRIVGKCILYSGKFLEGENYGNLMSKAISEIKFRKSRVESLEKSMSRRTIVIISEIYFCIFPKFPRIFPSENFLLYGNYVI